MSSTKFQLENLTVTVDFKDEFTVNMTVSDNFTGDCFINEQAQLNKIKRETILAALSRKNEPQLKSDFNIVDIEPKKLIVTFTVNFDFLPTFSEAITLDQVINKGSGFNKVESAQIRNEIEELERLVQPLSNKNPLTITSESTSTLSPKCDIFEKALARGSYLVEMSGLYLHTSGAQTKSDLAVTFEVGDEKWESNVCLHTNSSYGYPYSLRKQITLLADGTLKIKAEVKQQLTSTLSANIITVSPVLILN